MAEWLPPDIHYPLLSGCMKEIPVVAPFCRIDDALRGKRRDTLGLTAPGAAERSAAPNAHESLRPGSSFHQIADTGDICNQRRGQAVSSPEIFWRVVGQPDRSIVLLPSKGLERQIQPRPWRCRQ
jgi:hypothetical protein